MIKILFILLAFIAGNSNAAAPVTKYKSGQLPDKIFDTVDALSRAQFAVEKASAINYDLTYEGVVSGRINYTFKRCIKGDPVNCADGILGQGGTTVLTCASGAQPNLSMPLAQQCPDVESAPCAETVSKKVTYVVSNNGKDIIYNPHADGVKAIDEQKCTLKISETVRCYTLPKSSTPNKAYCTFIGIQTGGKGDNGEPVPVANPGDSDQERTDVPPAPGSSDGSCPKGTVNAGLSSSGIPMCIGQGTDPKNAPAAPPKVETEKNETLPNGSTQNTKTVTTTNADGSKTTTKTVTVTSPSGEKSTNQDKTTTNTPSGAAGKETQPDEKKGDLCKENPNLAICKNSTVTGKCGEIACMGDAIQCATLRAAAAMQCQQDKDIEALTKSPSTTLGNSILSGKDPKQGEIDLAMKSEEIDLSREKLDNQGFLGGGTCLRPITVNLPGGNTYTQSFDLLCEEIQPLRYVIMFMAYVSAYMIVVRTVLGS